MENLVSAGVLHRNDIVSAGSDGLGLYFLIDRKSEFPKGKVTLALIAHRDLLAGCCEEYCGAGEYDRYVFFHFQVLLVVEFDITEVNRLGGVVEADAETCPSDIGQVKGKGVGSSLVQIRIFL